MYLVLEMDLGGLQRIVHLLINRIDKEHFTPYLCCLDRGGLFYDQLDLTSIKSCILERRPGIFDGRLFKRLCRFLKEENIDIIHSQNGCSFYAALAGKAAGVIGVIHTDHGRLVPDKRSAIWEDRLSSLAMNRVVGVSDSLTEYLASEVKISRRKLTTIINGVDTDKFIPVSPDEKEQLRITAKLSKRDKVLGTVCRLDPVKNLDFLIRCLRDICKAIPECKVLIVGDGPSKEQLIRYADEIGVSPKVVFMGRSNWVEKILPLFDLYVCTSLSEGTPMTILEAMACGLPIIASDVGGNSKLVDQSNGTLFQLNDEDTFKKEVIASLNNFERLDEMGRESRRRVVNDFNLDHFVRQYEELYRAVYEGTKTNPSFTFN